MKSAKLSFDFSDNPKLVEALRLEAATSGKSQKAILIEALEAYLGNRFENAYVLSLAEKAFESWDNAEDEVYDTL